MTIKNMIPFQPHFLSDVLSIEHYQGDNAVIPVADRAMQEIFEKCITDYITVDGSDVRFRFFTETKPSDVQQLLAKALMQSLEALTR